MTVDARAGLQRGEGTAPRPEVLARFGAWERPVDEPYRLTRDLPIYHGRLSTADTLARFLDPLPFLTRADLRSNFPQGFLRPTVRFADLVASKKVEVVRTSGTSSDRLQVLWADGWWQRQEIAGLRSNPYIAARLDDHYREAVLTTPFCSENVCQTGPTPMEERCIDYLLFLNTQHDPTHWDDGNLRRMLDEMERFQPVSLDADPVYLSALARFIRRTGAKVPRLKWIVLAYELVSAIDREAIRSVFDCPTFDCYGLTEAGIFFLECTAGRHHFCGSDAVVEIIRPADLPATVGEIVVTTWCNAAQPLLRYRTGDLVRVAAGECGCGTPGPTLASFEGRGRDVLRLPDGTAVTPRQIDSALFGTKGLWQYRCVQERPQALRIEYFAWDGADPSTDIGEQLRPLFPAVALTARAVRFIPPEQSGKYRTVVPL